jgi:hypothetical protein
LLGLGFDRLTHASEVGMRSAYERPRVLGGERPRRAGWCERGGKDGEMMDEGERMWRRENSRWTMTFKLRNAGRPEF